MVTSEQLSGQLDKVGALAVAIKEERDKFGAQLEQVRQVLRQMNLPEQGQGSAFVERIRQIVGE